MDLYFIWSLMLLQLIVITRPAEGAKVQHKTSPTPPTGSTGHKDIVMKAKSKKPSSSRTRVTSGPPISRTPSLCDSPPTTILTSISDTIKKLECNYNRQDPPQKDRPTEVQLGIYVTSVSFISEQTMDYGLSMYFRQAWRDPRLVFAPINNRTTSIRLYDGSWNKFWVPDTFFRNEKRATFHSVTVSNRMLKLNSTGHMWYVIRITATLSCPMKLQYFPLDSQSCPMMFESFGYKMDTVYFGWIGDDPVDIPPELELPQFNLVDKELKDCSTNYTTGSYPCAEIRFVLRRAIGYFVIQVFVPSILTVIMSWVSFWINIDGVPARVSLGLLTVLTITTQSSGVNASMPKVSYIKAIDVWMIVCLIFVFCALLEYAFVNVAARNGVRIRAPIVRQASLRAALENTDLLAQQIRERNRLVNVIGAYGQSLIDRLRCREPNVAYSSTVDLEASKRRARDIDKMSRKTFPLAFVFFNIIYWVTYSIPSEG